MSGVQAPQNSMSTPLESNLQHPYPDEKAAFTPRGEPPVESHPAHFAPYDDQTIPVTQADPLLNPQSQPPLSLRPTSTKTSKTGLRDPDRSGAAATVSPVPVHDQSSIRVMVPDLVYNPDSLVGPNVAPEAHRPGQISHPNSAVSPDWQHSLCELDIACCVGFWCPCILYGKTEYRLSQKAQRQDPTDLLGYQSCNGSCMLMTVACGFQWALAFIQRTRIRKLYRLEGSIGTDCLRSLCCYCCVLMQDEREIRDREELIRRHAGPASGAYISPEAMKYPVPL